MKTTDDQVREEARDRERTDGGAGDRTGDRAGEPTCERDALTRDLLAMSRALYQRGWMEGTSGNISVLPATPPEQTSRAARTALISASGRSKGELTERDIVPADVATGKPLRQEGPRPSAETSIHVALYRTVAKCRAVIHAHAPFATAAAAVAAERGERALHMADFELIKGLGHTDLTAVTIPVFTNWPDVARIGADVEAYARATDDAPPLLLIAHHGATVWGPTLEVARNRLECLEGICRLLLLSRSWSAAS